MKYFRFLHTADFHIDIPFSSLAHLDGTAAERRIEQRLLIKKVIRKAADEEVDAIFISGDLFEHEYVSRASISFLNECFGSIPHIRVFISPGNHDPYVKNSYYRSFQWSENVHIFDTQVRGVNLDHLNACIYGVGFNDFLMFDSKLKEFKAEDESKVNILVTHADLNSMSGGQGYHGITSTDLEDSGLDYIALGHIHKYTDSLVKGKACYPGSPIALGFDEPGPHGVVIGEVSKKGAYLEFQSIDKRQYVTLNIDVTGCQSPQSMASYILEALNTKLDHNNYYKIVVEGMIESRVIEDVEVSRKIVEEALNGYAAVVRYEVLPKYDYEDMVLGNDLKALFVRKMLAGIDRETDQAERVRLRKALYIGICALEGRRAKLL